MSSCPICGDNSAVTLPCGHSLCQVCHASVLVVQELSGRDICPECPIMGQDHLEVQKNVELSNAAEHFLATQPEQDKSEIFCSFCVLCPIPAVKTCVLCEASLCDIHVRAHTCVEPLSALEHQKCPTHKKPLQFYCCDCAVLICICCLDTDHKGHGMKHQEKVAEMEKTIVSDNMAFSEQVSEDQSGQELLSASDLCQVEVRKDEISKTMVKELCSMFDPLVILENLNAADNETTKQEGEEEIIEKGLHTLSTQCNFLLILKMLWILCLLEQIIFIFIISRY